EYDVLCLQEVPRSIDSRLSFKSSKWHLVLPSALRRGPNSWFRSAIYVNANIPTDSWTPVSLNSLDLTAVSFSLCNRSFSIYSVY
ncbi:hypothetical protein GGG16DRAFT_37604, partial [Schizophyllum commune]